MIFKQKIAAAAFVIVGALSASSAASAALNTGDRLTISPGVWSQDEYTDAIWVTLSWFGMDTSGNGKIGAGEQVPLAPGPDGGIIIGHTQDTNGHVSHPGLAHPFAGGITNEWNFFNAGMDFTTVPITGGTSGLDMSGWSWDWNGLPSVNMGSGAWGTGFNDGVANFVWSGVYDTAYTLDYHATVPLDDPSVFRGVRYALHLEGIVKPVPVPAAGWLLGSGLIGLAGLTRSKATRGGLL